VNTPSCGAPHHLYPDTLCTEPAGHYRRDRDPHAGPLIVDGRERGGAAWDEPKERRVNDRHTADTITDDALDALYEQLEARDAVLAMYTAQLQRDQAALDRVRAVPDHPLAQPAPPDHEQVGYAKGWMAASAAYLAALDEQPAPEPCDGRPCAGTGCSHEQAAAALTAHDEAAGLYTAPAPAATDATGHVYLSTGCLHGHHDYCQNHTGHSGTKTPAQCKFCAAPCTCHCHQDGAQP
jgi:hypothetical protein